MAIEIRPYEHEEYERLVAAARGLDQDHYLLALLGGDAGLRKGEIVGYCSATATPAAAS